jgi:hypothetical protein
MSLNHEIQNADGLGWRWEKATSSLSVLFEVADGCDLTDGTKGPAGIKMVVGGVITRLPSPESITTLIKAFILEGVKVTGDGPALIAGSRLTPITWQKYLDEYADDDGADSSGVGTGAPVPS